MYLLQETQIKIDRIDLVHGLKISEEEKTIYDKAKVEFLERLREHKRGVALVGDIFRLMDELTEEYLEENEITCHRGCSWCCYQLVCCTTLEMELIIDYISLRPKPIRRSIKQKAKKDALDFYRYYQRNILASSSSLAMVSIERWEDVGPALRKAHRERPCIFLDKDLCSIYPVRPVDCRSAKTKDKICGTRIKIETEGTKQTRLFSDQIASDLITYEEERIYGKLQVVPLIGWPISEEFYSFFFSKGGTNWKEKKKKRKRRRASN